MQGGVAIHGLEARQGEPAFAFFVLRLSRPMDRAELVGVLRHLSLLIPDAESTLASFPDEIEEAMQLVGMPWLPPEGGEVEAQRARLERAAELGVEAAWFFQTGTSLPSVGGEDEEDDDDEDEDDGAGEGERARGAEEVARAIEASLAELAASDDDDDDDDDDGDDDDDDDDEGDDDEGDDEWSHGPPPQRMDVPFPVDGYPEILDDLDWEDFGVAFKLAGPFLPGETTVLFGFHALWLSPYGTERYRNASVTVDRRHHSAHLWVDRFAVPCSPEEQVGHLLWVLSRLHEVTPVLHARFDGASMAQKYGSLMGDPSEPFVLGGNPLIAIHAERGEAGVDRWIEEQADWSKEEVAQMLRELADLIAAGDEGDEDDEDGASEDDLAGEIDGDDAEPGRGEEGEEGEESGGSEDEETDGEDGGGGGDEDEAEEDQGRYITAYAGELLRWRAVFGALDPRAGDALRPLLNIAADKREHRRIAAAGILGALRDRASAPALIRLLEETPIQGMLDSIGKEDLLAEAASALGAIADPAAIPALCRLAAARGRHHDRPRPAAVSALAACLAAAPEPRDVDDAVLGALLESLRERDGGELGAELQLAYGELARTLPPPRQGDALRRLAELAPAEDDDTARLAHRAALALGGASPEAGAAAAAVRPLVHAALTAPGQDHPHTVRNIRIALRAAEALPELVAPADLVGLTRFAEPDLRARAHALLERLQHGLPPARCFDARAACDLSDAELVERAGDPHVIGRAALVGEIALRDLEEARAVVRAAVQDVAGRAPPGDRALLAQDERLLDVAIPWLVGGELDGETIALLDRILRHPSHHLKWELLEALPADERLLGGMFHVLSERWSWQESAARQWLRRYEGTAAFEAARRRAGVTSLDGDDDGADAAADGAGDADAAADDDEMN